MDNEKTERWAIGETEPAHFDEQDLLTAIKFGSETVCWVDSTPVDNPEIQARCDLIAAAPELLDTMNQLTDALCQHYGSTLAMPDAIRDATNIGCDVIAKALGKS